MPVHGRQRIPEGHGEVLCSPPFGQWAPIAEANRELLDALPTDLSTLRREARLETAEGARAYSRSIGITGPDARQSDLIVMTGHQPELYHPGIWVKDFLVQRLADATGALGIDLVVDTDAADAVQLKTPCLSPDVRVCRITLADGSAGQAYVQVPVPDDRKRAAFRAAGVAALATLPAPALVRHFEVFCDALDATAGLSRDLGTLVTAARRVYERSAGTDYLEVQASAQARTRSYRRFAASLLLDAERFRAVYNAELGSYRVRTGTRSPAQPAPDLDRIGDRTECPFWLLDTDGRSSVSVDGRGRLYARDAVVAHLGSDVDGALAVVEREDLVLAPKALALTLFHRLFVADLFVHGTGGGRYDRVTDAIIAKYYGMRAPAYAVASMTLMLPLGARLTTDADVAAAEQRLARLDHNPDQLLGEVEFDTTAEREEAERLVERKASLVAAIAMPGAERKALGEAIREANEALAALMAPFVAETRGELERVRASRDATGVLTDRTYPFCLWDPREVMDKVR